MKSPAKFLRYVVGGLIIGGFWYLNRSRPPWEEALRTIVVFSVIMVFVKSKLKNKPVEIHLVPLIGAKAVLVVIAAAVEQIIRPSVSDPVLVVAIGLGIAVMLMGAVAHNYFFTLKTPAATQSNHAIR